ncbi:hypothetical protein OHT76_43795 [Streptomyces sp. NBC_00287]|uniref:VOC family protein n=1 Tax=Streptomyces sp. NBC_00287 TaxID=2975702 RepID=UPI002E2D8EF0|nr:VOC family protein [Streptomyces sp. NBC_00287]
MSPGNQAAENEAAAPMAAGARLEAMRRRVRLSRLAVWTVIAAGPIALGVAITSTPTTVEAATPDEPAAAVRTTAVAADPAGYAQLFVSTWLRSSADAVTTAQARLAQSMAPDIELPEPPTGPPPGPGGPPSPSCRADWTAPGLHGDERMAALEAECERLVGLGATRLRRDEPAPPTSAGYIVMADPEGNEFCRD